MHGTKKRAVAIVEREYLIAIDIQRIIEDQFDFSTRILAPNEAAEKLQVQSTDILLVDASIDSKSIEKIVAATSSSRAKLILLTLGDDRTPYGWDGRADANISKPFTDEQVIEAVRSTLNHNVT